jgi:hypothetical protein
MNFSDPLKFTGAVEIVRYDANNNEVERVNMHNLVVDTGKQLIAKYVTDVAADPITHMAVGTGSTAAAAGQTALTTEAGRVALSTKTASGAVMSFVGIYPPGTATGSLVEAGLFTAASAGTMLCRSVFSAITKGADDTVSITWSITVT